MIVLSRSILDANPSSSRSGCHTVFEVQYKGGIARDKYKEAHLAILPTQKPHLLSAIPELFPQ